MAIVTLGLLAPWNPALRPGKNAVLIVHAYHAAGLQQKVTVSGPGIPGSITGTSTPGTPMGTVFLSKEVKLDAAAIRDIPLLYTLDLKYIENGKECDPTVLAIQGTQLGPCCVSAFAFANDKNGPAFDLDFNDTVVTLSLFPYSAD